MNEIDRLLRDLENQVSFLWKSKAPEELKRKTLFSNFYDLIIRMWGFKVIVDSSLAMDILNFYNKYKKYRFFFYDDIYNYDILEKEAIEEYKVISDKLKKI
ncbi:hypothetical protein [Acetoanaerobium noterae]|uniref:hypothetical protein n=1 Tax=Acetoanaerobium noterae TaxID=745369 RepID=UPI00333F4618